MHIVIGSDHAGLEIKQVLIQRLSSQGYTVTDVGTDSTESCDYPDYAFACALEVERLQREGTNVRGILLCGSGIGMSIAANKVPGARAALALTPYMASQGVEHDAANIVVFAARISSQEEIIEMMDAFLNAEMSKEEKYHRRLNKLQTFEQRVYRSDWEEYL